MGKVVLVKNSKFLLVCAFLFILLFAVSDIPQSSAKSLGMEDTHLDNLVSSQTPSGSPPRPADYCWASTFTGPILPSPSHHPGEFLYSPIDLDLTGGHWTSQMDHTSPNYKVDNTVSSLAAIITGTATNKTVFDKLIYYRSSFDGLNYGYDGHDGSDFRTIGLASIAALAAAEGTVTAKDSGCQSGWGCYIEITHDNGYLTKYSHLKPGSLLVNVGQRVVAGQKIATVGDSGASKGIHLHFSVFHWNPNSVRNVSGTVKQGGWEVTDPWGWNPWSVYFDFDDPLFRCNGERSYNLWINRHPIRLNATPTEKPVINAYGVGGWYDENDDSFVCQPPINGQPNNVNVTSDSTGKVTFSWQPSSCSGLDYYTFRISDHSNIDYEPWIVDHGVSNTATSTKETIPTQYLGKQLYWSIWAHGSSGYSLKSGPWSFIVNNSLPPEVPPLSSDYWNTQYFDDKNLTYQCGSSTQFAQTFVFKNWNEDSPSSGCPADNWSARMERNVYFPGGSYSFALEADDWARIYLDNALFVDHWNDATGHYEGYIVNQGYHTVRIEFADTLGGARVSAWWWGPGFEIPHDQQDFSQWHVNYWPYSDQYWDPFVSVNIGSGTLSYDWGSNEQPYGLPADSFSAKFRRQFVFSCGTYQFDFNHDDGITFLIDGQKLVDRWVGPIGPYSFVSNVSQGLHLVEINYHETGGSAHLNYSAEQISTCAPAQTPILNSPQNGISLNFGISAVFKWNLPADATKSLLRLYGDNGVDYSTGWINEKEVDFGSLWPGVYTWTITAANQYGNSPTSQTWSFTVLDPADFAVNAQFDAYPSSGPAPLEVSFHIVDTSNAISCLWDYGDGQTGSNCAPYHTHTYSSQGSYSVTLRILGSFVQEDQTLNSYITVTPTDGIYRTFLPLTTKPDSNKITVFGNIEDVEIGMIDCLWADCINSPSADFIYQGNPVGTVAGSKNDDGTYTLKKIFLFFDTSAIPDTATIKTITFGVKTGLYVNGTPLVRLVKSNVNIPVQYSDVNNYIYQYSLLKFHPQVDTWHNQTVVPVRNDWINKTGITKLALVEWSEIIQIAPNSINDAVFHLAEDVENRPYLTIEYSP